MKKQLKFSRAQLEQAQQSLEWYGSPPTGYADLNLKICMAVGQELNLKLRQKLIIEQDSYSIKLAYSQALLLQFVMESFWQYQEWEDRLSHHQAHSFRTAVALLDGAIKGAS